MVEVEADEDLLWNQTDMRKRAKPVEVRLDARTSKRVVFLLHLVTIVLR